MAYMVWNGKPPSIFEKCLFSLKAYNKYFYAFWNNLNIIIMSELGSIYSV